MIFDELRPHADETERQELEEIAERLAADRPVPRPGFRAELRAHLHALESSRRPEWRPQRLRLMIGAYAGSGLALLVVAALGVAGAGPLGY